MNEKVKTICLIFITSGILMVCISISLWGIIYTTAYKDCVNRAIHPYICIGILSGRGN